MRHETNERRETLKVREPGETAQRRKEKAREDTRKRERETSHADMRKRERERERRHEKKRKSNAMKIRFNSVQEKLVKVDCISDNLRADKNAECDRLKLNSR